MGYHFEIIEGHILRTEYISRSGGEQIWDIYLENIFWGGKISFPMCMEEGAEDRICGCMI